MRQPITTFSRSRLTPLSRTTVVPPIVTVLVVLAFALLARPLRLAELDAEFARACASRIIRLDTMDAR